MALYSSFIQVAERFIAAISESLNPAAHMSFFINFNPDDILRQANESTLRYKQGTLCITQVKR